MTRQLKKGALLFWGALALCLATAAAQTPVTKKPYIYWYAPGDTAWTWKPLIVDPPLTVTMDASGQFHLSMPAIPTPTPPLMLIDPFGGISQPITGLVIGPEMLAMSSLPGTLQLNVNSAVLASRVALQSGYRSSDSSGNPQTCISTPLPPQDPDNPPAVPLVAGQDYQASCSTKLVKLVQYQVLNWAVDVPNVGPVSLNIDGLGAMPVLDQMGNPLVAGQLAKGLWRIWNDGANWRVSEL